jgi:hypothetical protein
MNTSTLPELAKAALRRLEKALDEENAALAAFDSRNLGEYSRIKTQSLLELQRAAAVFGEGGAAKMDPEISIFFEALRQKLELNRWLLLLHLEAAREVTTVITSAIRDAESDGTYSRVSGKSKQ